MLLAFGELISKMGRATIIKPQEVLESIYILKSESNTVLDQPKYKIMSNKERVSAQ